MISKSWITQIETIKNICAGVKMPVSVEVDNTPDGIDGELILGDIPMVKQGDVSDVNFNITLRYSTPISNWAELISRLSILSQPLLDDQKHIFTGWVKEDNDSKLIYNGLIILKSRMNKDLLV